MPGVVTFRDGARGRVFLVVSAKKRPDRRVYVAGPPGPRTTRSDGKANVRTRKTLLNSLSPLSTSKVFS